MMKTKLFGWLLAFTLVLGLCAVPVVPAATEAASAAEGSWQVTNGTADGGLLTASGTEISTSGKKFLTVVELNSDSKARAVGVVKLA